MATSYKIPVNLGHLFPLFVTASTLPPTFLNDFLDINAQNFPHEFLPYNFELIRSRSSIDEQIAAQEASMPNLCGTKPPVDSNLVPVDREDSFVGATLDEIARFIKDNFIPAEHMNMDFFVVIDEDSLLDYSVIIAEIRDNDMPDGMVFYDENDDYNEEEESDEEYLEFLHRPSQLAHDRREAAMKRSPDGERVPLSVMRMGIPFCSYIRALSCTGMTIEGLRGGCSLDGVYWDIDFDETEPPPMDQRARLQWSDRRA